MAAASASVRRMKESSSNRIILKFEVANKVAVVHVRVRTARAIDRYRLRLSVPRAPSPRPFVPLAATSLPMPLASSFQFPDLRPPRFHHPLRPLPAPSVLLQPKPRILRALFLFFIGVKTLPPHTDRNKSCPFPEEEIPPACAASRRYRPWDCVSWTSTLFSKRLAPPCFGDLLPWSSQLE